MTSRATSTPPPSMSDSWTFLDGAADSLLLSESCVMQRRQCDVTDELLFANERVFERFDDVFLLNHGSGQALANGTLSVSNFRLLFVPFGTTPTTETSSSSIDDFGSTNETFQLSFPLCSFATVERLKNASLSAPTHYLCRLTTKSFRSARFALASSEHAKQLVRLCENLAFFPFIEKAFAFQRPADAHRHTYDANQLFERLGLSRSLWRVSDANAVFELCETYPRGLIVPATVDDQDLERAATFRSKKRLPAVTWAHPKTRAVVCRSSQPMVGVTLQRSEYDERLIGAVREASTHSRLHVVDCRPRVSAYANGLIGRGTERIELYEKCELRFCHIPNIHTIRQSAQQLFELCQRRVASASESATWGQIDDWWQPELAATRWMENVQLVLAGSSMIADLVHDQASSVLIHCSDGWDRTSQLASLAQLLLDPHYRTLGGFCELVSKDWLAFGHKFNERSAHGLRDYFSQHEASPIFLQWCDAVHQLLLQFPCSFEFNERLLVSMVDATYDGLHGTFLVDSERDRVRLGISKRTTSFWTFVERNREDFSNVFFQTPTTGSSTRLRPALRAASFAFWSSFFLRDIGEDASSGSVEVERRAREMKSTLEDEVDRLRDEIRARDEMCRRLENELGDVTKKYDSMRGRVSLYRVEGGQRVLISSLPSDARADGLCRTFLDTRIIDDYSGEQAPEVRARKARAAAAAVDSDADPTLVDTLEDSPLALSVSAPLSPRVSSEIARAREQRRQRRRDQRTNALESGWILPTATSGDDRVVQLSLEWNRSGRAAGMTLQLSDYASRLARLLNDIRKQGLG